MHDTGTRKRTRAHTSTHEHITHKRRLIISSFAALSFVLDLLFYWIVVFAFSGVLLHHVFVVPLSVSLSCVPDVLPSGCRGVCYLSFTCSMLPVFLPTFPIYARVVRVVFVLWRIIAIIWGCPCFESLPLRYQFSIFICDFFCDFFIFHFFVSCFPPDMAVLPSIYPLFCPTIARMSFCVQLVTRCNLKRLQRKYGFCILCLDLVSVLCLFGG